MSILDTVSIDSDKQCQWAMVSLEDQEDLDFLLKPHENPRSCPMIQESDGIYCQRHQILSEMLDKKGFGNK